LIKCNNHNNKGEEGNGKDSDKVKDEYKKNYEMKQNQWKMEDIQQGNLEKLEKEKKKETKLFLNQIRKRPRFAQIFVDQYSLRDENVNKNIIEISKYLGRNLYDKKNLNMKIEKYLQEIEKNSNIKEENSMEEENSLNKEQLLIQEMILKNLNAEDDDEKEYEKLGINEKQEILNLVKSGRIEKSQEEIFHEDFNMFQTFKQDVIKKETMYKLLGKTQFKNQILHYSDYSGTQVNPAANTGTVNINREFYENYHINPNALNNNHFNNNLNNININSKEKIDLKKLTLKKLDSGESLPDSRNVDPNILRSADSKDTPKMIRNNNKFSPKFSTEEINYQENNLNSGGSNFNLQLPPINMNGSVHSGRISNQSSKRSQKENILNTNNNIENLTYYSKGIFIFIIRK